jgi:3-dehydroquinate synthase
VVADQAFLTSLPPEELSSGLGEVVKYALLSGVSFMEDLQADADRIVALEPAALSAVVERCVRIKADVVALDEKDTGGRAVLNLGHTIGHALEHAAGYGNLSHGAAVGLGILAALRVSESACGLDPSLLPRVRGLLALFGLPTRIDGVSRDAILAAVPRDKKTSAEGLGFVCLRSPGDPEWGVRVGRETLASAVEVILE